jgi:hypothetical protein
MPADAAMCPLVCVFGMVACTVHYWVDARALCKVYRTRGEGHGHLYRMMTNRCARSCASVPGWIMRP